ncbi:MAG TPA: chorismate synthase [Gammaproteobacteria bacterium]|nr:chorismate synthase [Gammaproteobacteria bacterium]
MTGNRFGRYFSLSSFGESHGTHIGGMLDGVPAGLAISETYIQAQMDRRKPGNSSFTSQRKEADKVAILSGILEGITLGTPIGFLIANTDAKPKDYTELQDVFRPGHGDYVYQKKYGIRDSRGGGRASARETAVRVAAGAIAKTFLKAQFGIEIYGYLVQMGEITIAKQNFNRDFIEQNPFFCPDPKLVDTLAENIHALRKNGESTGALIEVIAEGVPVGLGEPVYHGLDADLAHAFMSINAVKGVSIGDGFTSVTQTGSYHRDQLNREGFLTNHAGGILAGISTGQLIKAALAFKPTSSVPIPCNTLTHLEEEVIIRIKGRHDPCVGLRGVPIAEAMMALVLADHAIARFGNKPIAN